MSCRAIHADAIRGTPTRSSRAEGSNGGLARSGSRSGVRAVVAGPTREVTVLAEVAHDLRSPLNGISMAADLIEHRLAHGDASHVSPLLDAIRAEAARMNRLIADLLDAGRAANGGVRLEPIPLEPAAIIAWVQEEFEDAAAAKNVSLSRSVPDPLPRVAADVDRIQQVLANLIENAIHFTPEGGHIRVTARMVPDAVRFAVTDTGPGIEAADRRRIFEPFERGAQVGAGTGLGLFIARRIVEAHGGRIGVESVPGVGSTFYFDLPGAAQ